MTDYRLRFTGKALPLFGRTCLTALTIIIIYTTVAGPWAIAWLVRWVASHLRLDDGKEAQTNISGRQLMWWMWFWSAINCAFVIFLEQGRIGVAVGLSLAALQFGFVIIGRIIGSLRTSSGHLLALSLPNWRPGLLAGGWILSNGVIGYSLADAKYVPLNGGHIAFLVGGLVGCIAVLHLAIKSVIEFTSVLDRGGSALGYSIRYDGSVLWFIGRFAVVVLGSLPIITLPWTFRWIITEIVGKIRVERKESPTESTPKVQAFSRPGSSVSPTVPESGKGSSPISWRKVSLLATPIVLGVINLVEAKFERDTAFKNGKMRYSQLIGEGQEAERVAPEQGHTVGKQRKDGIIREATQHAKATIDGATQVADLEREVGSLKTPIVDLQAEKTMVLMRPQHEVMENVLQITRLALMKHEGIVIEVPEQLMKTHYVGHGRQGFSDAELERRVQSVGRLVELAAIAKDQEDLSRSGPPFRGCR